MFYGYMLAVVRNVCHPRMVGARLTVMTHGELVLCLFLPRLVRVVSGVKEPPESHLQSAELEIGKRGWRCYRVTDQAMEFVIHGQCNIVVRVIRAICYTN